MPHHTLTASFTIMSLLWCGVSASAETLRCQSINGNLNCAGSRGVSCQTINGRKTCVSGGGDVVQSFGGGALPDEADDTNTDIEQMLPRDDAKPGDRALSLHRDGSRTHLRTDNLLFDRN